MNIRFGGGPIVIKMTENKPFLEDGIYFSGARKFFAAPDANAEMTLVSTAFQPDRSQVIIRGVRSVFHYVLSCSQIFRK